MVAAVHGDDAVALAEVIDLGSEMTDVSTVAVNDQKGFAHAVRLVVKLDAVVIEGSAGGGVGAVENGGFPDLTGKRHGEKEYSGERSEGMQGHGGDHSL